MSGSALQEIEDWKLGGVSHREIEGDIRIGVRHHNPPTTCLATQKNANVLESRVRIPLTWSAIIKTERTHRCLQRRRSCPRVYARSCQRIVCKSARGGDACRAYVPVLIPARSHEILAGPLLRSPLACRHIYSLSPCQHHLGVDMACCLLPPLKLSRWLPRLCHGTTPVAGSDTVELQGNSTNIHCPNATDRICSGCRNETRRCFL